MSLCSRMAVPFRPCGLLLIILKASSLECVFQNFKASKSRSLARQSFHALNLAFPTPEPADFTACQSLRALPEKSQGSPRPQSFTHRASSKKHLNSNPSRFRHWPVKNLKSSFEPLKLTEARY